MQHEDDRQQRQQRILEEAQLSTKRNAAIAMRWATLYEKDVPQELQKALDEQKEWCDAILKSKDVVIGDLQSDLRSKDDQYVKGLIQFRKETGALRHVTVSLDLRSETERILQLMNDRFDLFFREKNRQIHEVENAFMMVLCVAEGFVGVTMRCACVCAGAAVTDGSHQGRCRGVA